MKAEDIVLGKTYRIRTWEDMEKEFPAKWGGAIDFENKQGTIFTLGMMRLCGMEFTPDGIQTEDDTWRGDFTNKIENWSICPEMLEEIPT